MQRLTVKGMMRSCLLLCIGLLLTACQVEGPVPDEDAFAVTYPKQKGTDKYFSNGAIYNSDTAIVLFETPKAKRIGDVLTIVLMEQTNAQKAAQNASDRDTDVDVTNPVLLGNAVSLGGLGQGYDLGFQTEAERSFDAQSQSLQNNSLTGNISVTVAEVLGNGNLVVKGEKWLRINTGDEYIRLSGIVRPQDIMPDNTVTSDKVANARIQYGGVGQNHDGQHMGWLSKFLWSSIFPF